MESKIMSTQIGNEKASPEALAMMRERAKPNSDWFAYQNHDMCSSTLGDLRFLQCGQGCSYATAPQKLPDCHLGIGWRFLLVGKVNLETGEVQ